MIITSIDITYGFYYNFIKKNFLLIIFKLKNLGDLKLEFDTIQ